MICAILALRSRQISSPPVGDRDQHRDERECPRDGVDDNLGG